MEGARTANRAIFLVSALLTGAVAGAFVWGLLFAMNLGISALWDRIPVYLGDFYPLIVCVIGGIVIGLFTKRFGEYPEELPAVMARVRRDGRYEYSDLAQMSAGAILPMVFGGSVGPEAGLTGAVAAICTWAGDRLKRFGSDFRELSEIGMHAALSAVFTAPFYGFAGAVTGERMEAGTIRLSKGERMVTYAVAILGAFGAFMLLSHLFGGGLSLPRYTDIGYGVDEFIWLIPVALVGGVAGWLFRVLDHVFKKASKAFGGRPVLKCITGGLMLGICGVALPFTMFAGEVQAEELNEIRVTMTVAVLVATGFVKIAVTAMCLNMGWRGGHLFPVIFSGISIGYGMSILLDIDPVFAVCASAAAVVGGVMRKPVIAVLLLFLCFPVHSVLVLFVSAFIASAMPLPKAVADNKGSDIGGEAARDAA